MDKKNTTLEYAKSILATVGIAENHAEVFLQLKKLETIGLDEKPRLIINNYVKKEIATAMGLTKTNVVTAALKALIEAEVLLTIDTGVYTFNLDVLGEIEGQEYESFTIELGFDKEMNKKVNISGTQLVNGLLTTVKLAIGDLLTNLLLKKRVEKEESDQEIETKGEVCPELFDANDIFLKDHSIENAYPENLTELPVTLQEEVVASSVQIDIPLGICEHPEESPEEEFSSGAVPAEPIPEDIHQVENTLSETNFSYMESQSEEPMLSADIVPVGSDTEQDFELEPMPLPGSWNPSMYQSEGNEEERPLPVCDFNAYPLSSKFKVTDKVIELVPDLDDNTDIPVDKETTISEVQEEIQVEEVGSEVEEKKPKKKATKKRSKKSENVKKETASDLAKIDVRTKAKEFLDAVGGDLSKIHIDRQHDQDALAEAYRQCEESGNAPEAVDYYDQFILEFDKREEQRKLAEKWSDPAFIKEREKELAFYIREEERKNLEVVPQEETEIDQFSENNDDTLLQEEDYFDSEETDYPGTYSVTNYLSPEEQELMEQMYAEQHDEYYPDSTNSNIDDFIEEEQDLPF